MTQLDELKRLLAAYQLNVRRNKNDYDANIVYDALAEVVVNALPDLIAEIEQQNAAYEQLENDSEAMTSKLEALFTKATERIERLEAALREAKRHLDDETIVKEAQIERAYGVIDDALKNSGATK